jgi:hypothetical protein
VSNGFLRREGRKNKKSVWVCVCLSVARNQHNNKEPNKTKTRKPDQNSKEELRKKAWEQANTLNSFRTDSKTTQNAPNLWEKQIFEDRNTTLCVCMCVSLSTASFPPPPPYTAALGAAHLPLTPGYFLTSPESLSGGRDPRIPVGAVRLSLSLCRLLSD